MKKITIKSRKGADRLAQIMIRKDGNVHTNKHGFVVFAHTHEGMTTMSLEDLFDRFHVPGKNDAVH